VLEVFYTSWFIQERTKPIRTIPFSTQRMENDMNKRTQKDRYAKINEFLGYAIGVSLIFVTGMMLLLAYAEVLLIKHMSK